MHDIRKERFDKQCDKPGRESWVNAIRDGKGNIVSYEVHTRHEGDKNGDHFEEMLDEEQEKVLDWLEANLIPRSTPMNSSTSYGMKHVLEYRTNIYMTNNQFKEAMLLLGYYPVVVDELNWRYCLSRRSPIFKMQEDQRDGLILPECVMDYHKAAAENPSATNEKDN